MLSAGPKMSEELIEQGGFSQASLHQNMNKLKAEGLVVDSRDGRRKVYTLAGELPEGESVTMPGRGRRGRKPKAAAGTGAKRGRPAKSAAASDLKGALGVLMARLSPIDNVGEKTMVLTQLAATLPKPVASVLNAIIDDLSRLSGGR